MKDVRRAVAKVLIAYKDPSILEPLIEISSDSELQGERLEAIGGVILSYDQSQLISSLLYSTLITQERKALIEISKNVGFIIPEVSEHRHNTGYIIENERVQKLGINKNKLISLPDSIGNLTSLAELFISQTNLSNLPESIGSLTSLVDLELRFNKLISLPENIVNLAALTSLDLYNNGLTFLPESIGKLKSLKTLNLDYNKLTSLPESIGNLNALDRLELEHNDVFSLPESIGNLTNLKFLRLNEMSHNSLSTIPNTIENLRSLETIYIKNPHFDGNKFEFHQTDFTLKEFISGVDPIKKKIAIIKQENDDISKLLDISMNSEDGKKRFEAIDTLLVLLSTDKIGSFEKLLTEEIHKLEKKIPNVRLYKSQIVVVFILNELFNSNEELHDYLIREIKKPKPHLDTDFERIILSSIVLSILNSDFDEKKKEEELYKFIKIVEYSMKEVSYCNCGYPISITYNDGTSGLLYSLIFRESGDFCPNCRKNLSGIREELNDSTQKWLDFQRYNKR